MENYTYETFTALKKDDILRLLKEMSLEDKIELKNFIAENGKSDFMTIKHWYGRKFYPHIYKDKTVTFAELLEEALSL